MSVTVKKQYLCGYHCQSCGCSTSKREKPKQGRMCRPRPPSWPSGFFRISKAVSISVQSTECRALRVSAGSARKAGLEQSREKDIDGGKSAVCHDGRLTGYRRCRNAHLSKPASCIAGKRTCNGSAGRGAEDDKQGQQSLPGIRMQTGRRRVVKRYWVESLSLCGSVG